MSVLNVDQFKKALKGGGARSNLFSVQLDLPDAVSYDGEGTLNEVSQFLVKTAEVPGSTISPIIIPFRGRQLKISGDKTFEPWTVTILNDVDFTIRRTLEKWMNYMNNHQDNQGESNPLLYEANLKVSQIDRNSGNPIDSQTWTFVGAWPSDLAAIPVSFDAENQIQEYQVTFQYQYWTSPRTS
jgi:hypothetical protein